MNLRVAFAALLCGAFAPVFANNYVPDRLYINLATQHFGVEDYFDSEGPNEVNFGLGFGWDITKYNRFAFGVYQDSYEDLAITTGFSTSFLKAGLFDARIGISATVSFGDDHIITNPSGVTKIIEPRRYFWPYLSLEVGNFYTQLRAGITPEGEPLGVFSFGFVFNDPFGSRRN